MMYGCLTGLEIMGTMHERQITTQIVEVEFKVLSLSVFFRLVWYKAVRQFSYDQMMKGRNSYDTLV